MEEAEAAVARAVEGLDPDDVPASEASRLFDRLERIVRSASAARTLLVRRVEDSMEWKRLGFTSAADHLAAKSGTSVGSAKAHLETSNALKGLPAVAGSLLEGSLSPDQGRVVAGAAKRNPKAQGRLIDKARKGNMQDLREEAAKVKAEADADPMATHARLHRERRASRFTDEDGARQWRLRGPVDEMAELEAEIDRLTDVIFRQRRNEGSLEPRDAYALDAFAEMARRSRGADDGPAKAGESGPAKGRSPKPAHLALLRLDITALWRGYVEGDELCEITGLGPIPVAVARRLLGDAVLKLILTKGVDVATVTSLTRGPTQAMRYAHLWTSPTCSAEGCTRTILEYDHAWGAEYKHTRHTRFIDTDPVCHGHHDLHTHHGWALVRGVGSRPMVPPDDPRHPAHAPPEARAGPALPTLTGNCRAEPESSDRVTLDGRPQPALFGHPAALANAIG